MLVRAGALRFPRWMPPIREPGNAGDNISQEISRRGVAHYGALHQYFINNIYAFVLPAPLRSSLRDRGFQPLAGQLDSVLDRASVQAIVEGKSMGQQIRFDSPAPDKLKVIKPAPARMGHPLR